VLLEDAARDEHDRALPIEGADLARVEIGQGVDLGGGAAGVAGEPERRHDGHELGGYATVRSSGKRSPRS